MPTALENYFFTELPRRIVAATSVATGSSFTESWVLVATGDGFQTVPVDPTTLGFEPEITQGTTGQYYRGDKTWATLDAAAVGAIAASEKGQPLGVATLDAEGFVSLTQMNPAVIERVVVVPDEAGRYALTTAQVQNGDVVNQQSPAPSSMWYVVDQTNLDNASGYLPFSSGVAASVAWSGITGKPAIVGDLENISLTSEGDLIQYVGGTWVNVSIATLKASLALEIADITSLQDGLDGKQSQSDVLDNLSSISTTGLIVRNSDGLFIGRELVGINGITVTEPKGDADNPSIGLSETGVTEGTYGDEFNYPVVEIDKFGRNISVTTQAITRNPIQIQDVPSTTLQANTEHILGNGVSTYTSNMSLDLPDNVPGGTWVKIKCGEDFEQVQGSVAIVAPVGKTVQGDPSFPFSSYFKLYPFGTVDMVYSSSTSNWTVLTNATSFLSSLHVARQGATNGPSNSHLIRSSATSPRTLDIPDRDVDLSSVGQTDFADNVFTVSDSLDPTKKVAIEASGIATGQTRTITMPDADVNLGALKSLNTLPVGETQLVQLRAGHDYFVTQSGVILGIQVTSFLGLYDTSIGYSFSNTTSSDLTVTVRWSLGIAVGPITVNHVDAMSGSTIASSSLIIVPQNYDYVYTIPKGGTLRLLPNAASNVTILRSFNVNLGNVAQAASASSNGYVTSADWTNFNNKEQGGYITVSSNFTAEVGKKYRTVWGLSSAITITPPATAVNGAYFTVFYSHMTSTGSVTCTNPNISAGPKDAWQEYEYTYDTTSGGWLPLRKSLGPIVPTGSSFQLVNPTNPTAKFIIQAPTSVGLYTLTMPNADVDLGNVAQAASTSNNGYLTSTDWTTFNDKQAALVSGTNIKTINGNNILGNGNLSLFTPRVSTVTDPAYTLQAADNDGNTYLRVNTASSATITIPSTQTTPITIRRVTSQSVTLQGGSGVTLNGSLTFDVVGSTKSIIPIGTNQFDIVG